VAARVGPLALGLVLAALGEELMFRGYPLRRLADAIGAVPAMLILAVLFGFAHARNPNATFFSTVNVALAAIWLSFAFFSVGGMALAWGCTSAGMRPGDSVRRARQRLRVSSARGRVHPGRHAWVDGGAFGPEGGIVTTLVLIAGRWP